MARETKRVTIDGICFQIGQIDYLSAMDIGLRMAEIHGEVQAAVGDVASTGAAVGGFGRGLAVEARLMRSAEFREQVVKPLLAQVAVVDLAAEARGEGGVRALSLPGVADDVFAGNVKRYTALIEACVEHNCGDFSTAFGGTNEILRQLAAILDELRALRSRPPVEGVSSAGGTPGAS